MTWKCGHAHGRVYGPGWLHPNMAIFTVVTIRSNAETSHQVPSGAQGFAAPPSEIIEVDEG